MDGPTGRGLRRLQHRLVEQRARIHDRQRRREDEPYYKTVGGDLLAASSADGIGRPLSPGTVHRVHVVLHRALTQAVRWQWIWLNPVANPSPPRVTPADIRPPTPDQIQRLVASVEETDVDFATYLWLAASTGARRSQMLGLRRADIDLTHSAIGFSRAYVDGPAGPVLRATKTHRTYRVAVDQASIQRLLDHYQRATQRASQHAHVLAGTAFVFSAEPDGSVPWLPNRVTKMFIDHRPRRRARPSRINAV